MKLDDGSITVSRVDYYIIEDSSKRQSLFIDLKEYNKFYLVIIGIMVYKI